MSTTNVKPGLRSEQRNEQRNEQRLIRPKEKADDRFAVTPPPGMSYQWVAVTIMGQQDTRVAPRMFQYHWTPVPAKRHPELFGATAGDEAGIIDGLMLCERPTYLNDESRAEEQAAARQQMGDESRRAGKLAPASGDPQDAQLRRPRMQRDYGDLAVPEDREPA